MVKITGYLYTKHLIHTVKVQTKRIKTEVRDRLVAKQTAAQRRSGAPIESKTRWSPENDGDGDGDDDDDDNDEVGLFSQFD